MADFRALVLQRHRRLKWKLFDPLEAGLMILCGVCIAMFTVSVFFDVLTRTIGAPWLWLQQVTTAFFAWPVSRRSTGSSFPTCRVSAGRNRSYGWMARRSAPGWKRCCG